MKSGKFSSLYFDELEPRTTGRPRTTDLREILNAIFYLNKAGCPWRYLPTDFPPYRLVNYYYNEWTDNRTLEKVNTALRQHLREAYLESGFDGGKLVKGRKSNILVDTMGYLIIVQVFAANVFDGKAARQLITELFSFLHTITKIWSDSGYSGPELSDWLWHPIRMPDRGR